MPITFNYDAEADALEIALRDTIVARTEQLDPGTLVDLDEQGRVVAIEVLRPARRWPIEEILTRQGIDEEAATLMRSLWSDDGAFPFVATGDELIPA